MPDNTIEELNARIADLENQLYVAQEDAYYASAFHDVLTAERDELTVTNKKLLELLNIAGPQHEEDRRIYCERGACVCRFSTYNSDLAAVLAAMEVPF